MIITFHIACTGAVAALLDSNSSIHHAAGVIAPDSSSFRAFPPQARAPSSHAARAPVCNGPAVRPSDTSSPAVKVVMHSKPTARAFAPRAPAANVFTIKSASGKSTEISGAAANRTPEPVCDLGPARSRAAGTSPGASHPISFPLVKAGSLNQEKKEGQAKEEAAEEEEEEEDSDDELCIDEDLSSWGSDEEIWGSDSDFYGSDDEAEGPMAGQYILHHLLCMLCMLFALLRYLLIELLGFHLAANAS